ncbi:hypothetical protein PENTCL1PPCAC_24554 [Pristionchus entomophagus]|uniref:Uncharacterized protein n=1 Tax=Pristionchus entomophagus TaxID=358040 RepID=A0AAV5U7K8_9BILA|nr:hypothetical protein PENTCL1PPCAC_24554 [Pristionchus entomophagus]
MPTSTRVHTGITVENAALILPLTRDLRSSKVDHVQKVEKFLVDNVLEFNFFLSFLGEISEEHGSEDGRVDSQDILRHSQLLVSNHQRHVARFIGRSEHGRIDDRSGIDFVIALRIDYLDDDFNDDLVVDDEYLIRAEELLPGGFAFESDCTYAEVELHLLRLRHQSPRWFTHVSVTSALLSP